MSRTRLLIGLLAVAAAAIAAATLAVVLPGSDKAAASPVCLPHTLEHSAKLATAPIVVSPAPQTSTANPDTQISLLGASVHEIHDLSVVGQHSGAHRGRLHGYSQGDGASFIPTTPFLAGERVRVKAMIASATTTKPIDYSFAVDTPYPSKQVAPFPNPAASPSEYQSFRTLAGSQAPLLTVTTPDRDPAAGAIFTTNGPGPGQYGPLIYSPQGRLIWFSKLSGGLDAEDLKVQSYEGQPHLTFWQGKVLSWGFGQGQDIIMDSHYQTVAQVKAGNGLSADLHDFQIRPHDIAYITAYNPIRCDLSSVGGARNGAIIDGVIQQIDIKTGLLRWEWHSLEHVDVNESQTAPPTEPPPWDWFHINSIAPQNDGDILVSARSTWAGYQLAGDSGEVLWRLGGTKSSFQMGPGTRTAWQHDGRVLPDSEVTFFDNGSNPPVHHQSRAVRIALDLKTHQAHLRVAYTHPNQLLAASQGDMQTLSSGNTVVGFGSVPEISEYGRNGSLLFDAHLPLEMDSYRSFRFPWSGRPLSPPAVQANLNNTDEETLVRMSWNGATALARWRVLAGKDAKSLQPQTTVSATSFESEAILPQRQRYVSVQALDARGTVLASSPARAVESYAAAFPSAGQ
jgi:Arylsulfotransferase (ASST)